MIHIAVNHCFLNIDPFRLPFNLENIFFISVGDIVDATWLKCFLTKVTSYVSTLTHPWSDVAYCFST